jgi:hypothetical protein
LTKKFLYEGFGALIKDLAFQQGDERFNFLLLQPIFHIFKRLRLVSLTRVICLLIFNFCNIIWVSVHVRISCKSNLPTSLTTSCKFPLHVPMMDELIVAVQDVIVEALGWHSIAMPCFLWLMLSTTCPRW